MIRLVIALALLQMSIPAPAEAVPALNVTIEVLNADGTVHQSHGPGNPPPQGFNLWASTTAGQPGSLTILSGGSQRFFPSGATTAQPGDTFRFQNSGLLNVFRCDKTDQSQDSLSLKGFTATVTKAGAGKGFG